MAPRDVGSAGCAACHCFLCLVGVATAAGHAAAPSDPAHRAPRRRAPPVVFPRRQSRRLLMERRQTRQSRRVCPTNRQRFSTPTDDDPGNDYTPAWSPDGRWIAFLRAQGLAGANELRLVPPLGGPERQLGEIRLRAEMLRAVSIAWCPDSSCLIVTDSAGEGKPDALFVVSLASGEKRQLTHPAPPVSADLWPAAAPDGSWLVFSRNSTPVNGELFRLRLGTGLIAAGEPSPLPLGSLKGRDVAWMPDGERILFSSNGGLWTLPVRGAGAPSRVPFVGENGLMPAVSRPLPGQPVRLVYVYSYQDQNIWRIDTPGPGAPAISAPVVAISSTKEDLTPSVFSPTAAEWPLHQRAPENWKSGSPIQMDPTRSNSPPWAQSRASPLVSRRQFDCLSQRPRGQAEAYLVSAAGGNPRNLTSHPSLEIVAELSPDGRWIYFQSNRAEGNSIWKVPSSGGDPVPGDGPFREPSA